MSLFFWLFSVIGTATKLQFVKSLVNPKRLLSMFKKHIKAEL